MGQGRFAATARTHDRGCSPCLNVQCWDAQAEIAVAIAKGELVNVNHVWLSLPYVLLEGLCQISDVLLHRAEKVALRRSIAARGKDQTPKAHGLEFCHR